MDTAFHVDAAVDLEAHALTGFLHEGLGVHWVRGPFGFGDENLCAQHLPQVRYQNDQPTLLWTA